MRINKFLYFGDFITIPAALAFFVYSAFAASGLAAALPYFVGLFGGLVVWTLAEYWIHRIAYHHWPVLSDLHDRHHEAPKELIGIPSFLSSGIVITLGYGPFFAFWPRFADGFVSGALIGYAVYMIAHHATHHWRIEPGQLLYAARVRHMAHHYHDEANFGIITGFWDWVFGTTGRRRRRDHFAGA
ncbi:MAG TPA: sterol desaturase family protein [Roseiarcus sp.]|nr:sterol desaturase family protein [Roseiarcus sp.]